MHPKLFEFIDQTMVTVHNAIAQFTVLTLVVQLGGNPIMTRLKVAT